MEYICCLANASLTLRLVEYLHDQPQLKVSFVTVINQINGWVVRIKLKHQVSPQEDGDFRSFLSELGINYSPPKHIKMALMSLAGGQSLVDVMRRYQVAVVCHGQPEKQQIEAFRQHLIGGLGYCPQTLA
ncbi:hypothetical protein G7B40_015250 [Aetokthonos hydrillicola Thurmond2011]|jgi:hypothetical protein|uniref:Uncharacterized protein n=1 Tax=Aetokthonos hydrillicola Thurmond2011 TaxID=2712845 RepID=A0AAP5MAQ3_9CYAN|nr:hypothetical protein [Aetokthonos hydrillicola]MBW4588757.1 hypothetical protein [Aetokthonos hydrillicola CCALA 1050]MDR9895909.1 hypothetical protein [Aetokthonos hydrillicola Thurmond2011]